MTPTKPTVVAHVVRPAAGGMREQVLMLAQGLDRRAFQPVVVAPADEEWKRRLSATGVPLVHVPLPPGLDPWRDFLAGAGLWSALRRLHPGLVHLHGYKTVFLGVPAALLARTGPVLATVHGSWQVRPALAGLALPVERTVCRRLDGLIAVSGVLGAALSTRGLVPRGGIHVIRNGIDLERFNPFVSGATFRVELGLASTNQLIGTICRLTPEKGIDVFLQAAAIVAARHPGARFCVVGDGPEEVPLKRLARTLGLDKVVTFTGRRTDIPGILAALDVFVLASRSEGLPLALIEAMAMLRPVVATAVGGCPEVVQDGVSGRLVAPGDVAGLSRAIVGLLEREEVRRSLGREARRKIELEFSALEMIRRTEEVYREVLTHALSR